jgi:hypothetical protein
MTLSTGLAILPRKTAGVPLRFVTLTGKLLYIHVAGLGEPTIAETQSR